MYLCRKPHVLLLVVIALLTSGAAVRAQQDADMTVIIKAKTKPAALPTLLILCDLACNLRLNGETKGLIDAGGSTKIKVEPGQHMVEATTEDGVDQVKQPCTVKPTGQTMVSIELWPIRYARLLDEQAERDTQLAAEQERRIAQSQAEQRDKEKVANEVQAKSERERKEKADLEEHDRAAHEEAVGLTWTDISTSLMWTKKGKNNLNWKQATAYCQNLQLAGYSDWRLPMIDELQSIYDNHAGIGIRNVKGNLQLPKWWWEWSSSQGDSSKEVLIFDFEKGFRFSSGIGRDWSEVMWHVGPGTLCVRRINQ